MATLEKIASVSARVVFDRYGHKTGQDVLFYHAESLTKIGSADPKEIEAYFDLTEKIGSYLFTSVCDQYGLDAVKVAHWAEYERKLPWFYLDELVEGLQKTAAVTQVGSKVLSGTRAVLNPLVQAEKAVAQNVGQSAARAVTPPKPPAAAFGRTPKPAPASATPPQASNPSQSMSPAELAARPAPRPTAQTGATKGTAPTGQTNITSRGQTTGPNPATAAQSDATIAKSFPVPDAPLNLGATEGAAQQAAKKTWGQRLEGIGDTLRNWGSFARGTLPWGAASGGALAAGGLGAAALGGIAAAPVLAPLALAAGGVAGIGAGVKAIRAGASRMAQTAAGHSVPGLAESARQFGRNFSEGWRWNLRGSQSVARNIGEHSTALGTKEFGALQQALGNPEAMSVANQFSRLPQNAIRAEQGGTHLVTSDAAKMLGITGQDVGGGLIRVSEDPKVMALTQKGLDPNAARVLADDASRAALTSSQMQQSMPQMQQFTQASERARNASAAVQQYEAEIASLKAELKGPNAEQVRSRIVQLETLAHQTRQEAQAAAGELIQIRQANPDILKQQRDILYNYNRANPITGMGAAAEAKAVGSSADEIARLSGGGAQAEKAFLQEGTQAGATGTAGAQAEKAFLQEGTQAGAAGAASGATGTAGAQAGAAGAAPGAAWTQSAHLEQQAVKAEMSGLSSQAQKLEQQIQTNTAAGLTDPAVRAQTDELIRQRNALQSRMGTLAQRESQLNYMIEQNPQMQAVFGQDFSAAVLQSQGGAAAGATGGGLVQGVTDAAKSVASSVQEAAQPAVGAMRSFWNENKKTLVPLGLLGGAGYMGIKGIEALNRPAYAPQGY